jgi:hypothetical protein
VIFFPLLHVTKSKSLNHGFFVEIIRDAYKKKKKKKKNYKNLLKLLQMTEGGREGLAEAMVLPPPPPPFPQKYFFKE